MTRKKLFVGVLTTAMSLSVLSVPAFASNHAYSFSVTPSNDIAYTAGNPKDDDEQRAYVYTQSGNIVSTDVFWFSVFYTPVNKFEYRETEYTRVTSNSAGYLLDYTTRVYKGQYKYLQADTDKYTASVRGYWYS